MCARVFCLFCYFCLFSYCLHSVVYCMRAVYSLFWYLCLFCHYLLILSFIVNFVYSGYSVVWFNGLFCLLCYWLLFIYQGNLKALRCVRVCHTLVIGGEVGSEYSGLSLILWGRIIQNETSFYHQPVSLIWNFCSFLNIFLKILALLTHWSCY